MAVGCYSFVSQTTVMSSAPIWTGANHYTHGATYAGDVIGLAGQDIYLIQGNTTYLLEDYLLDEFGGQPYTLTSVAQTHTLGLHEHTFMHGNPVGQTGNLSLLHTLQGNPFTMQTVPPFNTTFRDSGQVYEVVQICDLAATGDGSYGDPNDASSHLFMSFRACPVAGGACVGGVMEVGFDNSVSMWSPRPAGTSDHVWVRKTSGSLFSNECMPIAATGKGDQTEQYLVVADPSWDEVTLFDASSVASGPLDSVRTLDSSFALRDIAIEGRGDGSVNLGMMTTLWGSSSAARLEHRVIANGDIGDDPPFLVESLPGNVRFIASRGLGVEGTSEQLYTFGSQLMRRYYQQ
ncbi:hypothetical protein [Haliangium ochraceum]|nr:hypothetical protein [Haliangium ochraceum]